MRRMATAMVGGVAVLMLVGGAGVASAATANWSGTVDSGGAVKVFDTQRTSTRTVLNKNTTGVTLGLGLVACTNLTVVGSDRAVSPNVTTTFSGSANRCFRQQIHRWYGADTNGWLPGNGTTSVKGTITW